jgi:hypothetical protein
MAGKAITLSTISVGKTAKRRASTPPSEKKRRTASSSEHREVVRDAAWEAEKRWFEENRSLDPLALFAKYYQRLG